MNYATLYAAVVDETENNDTTFVANIPTFVKNAEKRIYQAVKIPALRKSSTSLTFTANSPYFTVPTDYLSTWEFAVVASNEHAFLIPKDVSFIRSTYPNTTTTGTPKYYAQFSETQFIIGPTPSSAFASEIHYFYYPESLVTASTTWLGENFDMLLLYGTLVEAAVFMKSEEDTMKAYSEQYIVNLKLLKDYAEGTLRSAPYRK